jgi:hypothetical protein
MKNWTITIATIAIMGFGIRQAYAEHPNRECMSPRNILIKDVQLNAEQQEILAGFRSERTGHQEQHEALREMKKQRHALMMDYVAGDISRREMLKKVDEHQEIHSDLRETKQDMMLELLSTYDETQKDQVLDNLDAQESCMAEHRAEKEERYAKHSGKQSGKMVANLNLSAEQQELWTELKSDRRDHRGEHEARGELLQSYLEGDLTLEDLEEEQGARMAEKQDQHRQHIIQMMDFVDSLSQTQKDQLLRNMEEAQLRHAEKKGHRKK